MFETRMQTKIMYTAGSVWCLLIVLKPILMIEQ